MSFPRSKKNLLVRTIAVLAMITANCPEVYAGSCVMDYLFAVLPRLHHQYSEAKRSLRMGSVPMDRYSSQKNIMFMTPDMTSAEIGQITGRDLPKNHWLFEWIGKVQDQGAELRVVQYEQKSPRSGKWESADHYDGAYFNYDREAQVPYIALSFSSTPDAMAHEYDHLKRWSEKRDSLLKQSLDLQAANAVASDFFFKNEESILYAERSAVGKELQKESEIQRSVLPNNQVKWIFPSGALPFTEIDSLTRQLTYPEAEAVRTALVNKSTEAVPLMKALIRKALLLRLTSYQRAQEALATLPVSGREDFWQKVSQLSSSPGAQKAYLSRFTQKGGQELETDLELDVNTHLRLMEALESLDGFFDSIMLSIKPRFESAKVYDEARKLFNAQLPSVWESLPAKKRGDFRLRFKAQQ